MAAPGAFVFYQSFKEYIADGTFDLNTDTFKVALLTSSYTPAVSTDDILADISANEVAAGNGYTAGGVTLTGVTYAQTAGTAKFDADNASWTGSASGFSARYLVLYKSGTANTRVNPLVAYMLLDSAPADVTVAAGNTLTVAWHANGLFTLS